MSAERQANETKALKNGCRKRRRRSCRRKWIQKKEMLREAYKEKINVKKKGHQKEILEEICIK